MPTKKELEEIIEYCERKKRESGRVTLIVENIFRDKFDWAYRYPYIEIDRPLERANPNHIVYDSTTKTLWVNYLGHWKKLETNYEVIE